tara:strand:+ start:19907 stop:21274 length:1368 start_codon:yes stop_codon:yes gene_type:complete
MAIKPSIPKGTRDFSSVEIAKRNYLKNILQITFEEYGFSPIETPSFEKLETLTGVYGDEGDRLVFKILNSGEKIKRADFNAYNNGENYKFIKSISEKALRYDLTVPFARYVVQHQNELTFPFRRYQIQPVWRADRPQRGRFQEFIQCDADIVGNRSLWQEVEVLHLYDRIFNKLRLKDVNLRINHRNILVAIFTLFEDESRIYDFTVTLDKLNKIGKKEVFKELIGKNFHSKLLDILEKMFGFQENFQNKIKYLKSLFTNNQKGLEGISELEFIINSFKLSSSDSVVLKFDFSLARGLNYYTGMIVEVDSPENVNIGSIGGGGRYDDLTSVFGMDEMSGVGVSFGFERIFLVMDQLGLFPDNLSYSTKVLFINFGDSAAEIAYSYMMKLRDKNVSSELYPTAAKINKQMAYANSKGIKNVILMGSNEISKKVFDLKDMDSGKQTTYSLSKLTNLF